MRVVFAGTPPFAVRALAALDEAGHEVALVLTRTDRPAGRGLKVAPSAVAQWAQQRGFEIFKPQSLKDAEAVTTIRDAKPEVMVVAAYGLILPPAVLCIPANGCLNIHASLLPRWRGAAPIQRALLAGDRDTGISIMRMDRGLDTGPVLLEKPMPVGDRETAGSLTETLAALGAEAIVEAIGRLSTLVACPQDEKAATEAPKIAKSEARIDWSCASVAIDRQIRAFNPVPIAETTFHGEPLKIWQAEPTEGAGPPGRVLEAPGGLVVACGEGALRLLVVQRPGGKRLAVAEFLRGTPLPGGTVLGQKPLASA